MTGTISRPADRRMASLESMAELTCQMPNPGVVVVVGVEGAEEGVKEGVQRV